MYNMRTEEGVQVDTSLNKLSHDLEDREQRHHEELLASHVREVSHLEIQQQNRESAGTSQEGSLLQQEATRLMKETRCGGGAAVFESCQSGFLCLPLCSASV